MWMHALHTEKNQTVKVANNNTKTQKSKSSLQKARISPPGSD